MAVKELAETVILQSIEDLWDKQQQDACSRFFCGQGFSFWADAAGMTIPDRKGVLLLILDSISKTDEIMQEIHF